MPANEKKSAKHSGMTREAAKAFLETNQIKFVLAQFVDIHGVAKTKAVPVEHFEDIILEDGAGFAGFPGWNRNSCSLPDVKTVPSRRPMKPIDWTSPATITKGWRGAECSSSGWSR